MRKQYPIVYTIEHIIGKGRVFDSDESVHIKLNSFKFLNLFYTNINNSPHIILIWTKFIHIKETENLNF